MRQGHWAVVDLIGKGGHIRTVPIPNWVKAALDQWTRAAGVSEGRIFRAVARKGKVWGRGISQNVVWYVVRSCCQRAGLEHIAPHDLRRTCAKLCHDRGGELEQIQFLLGHASVQTTERYLGCKQNLGHPVNDLFNLCPITLTEAGEATSEAPAPRDPAPRPSQSKNAPRSSQTWIFEKPRSLRRCSEMGRSHSEGGTRENGQSGELGSDLRT